MYVIESWHWSAKTHARTCMVHVLFLNTGCYLGGLLSEFEFLEDFKPPRAAQKQGDDNSDEPDIGGNSEDDSESSSGNQNKREDWRPEKYRSSNHTIKLMV